MIQLAQAFARIIAAFLPTEPAGEWLLARPLWGAVMPALLVAPLLLLAAPTEAAQRLPAEVCEPLLAAEFENCEIEKIYRCTRDGETVIQHVAQEPGEADFVTIFTADYDMVTAFEESSFEFRAGVADNRDAGSLEALLTDGVDVIDQTVLMQLPMFLDPMSVEFHAEYRLTGDQLTIDGRALQLGEYTFELSFRGVSLKLLGEGTIYVDQSSGSMIEGAILFGVPGYLEPDGSPLAGLIDGSHPLFDALQPELGCGLMSRMGPTDVARSAS